MDATSSSEVPRPEQFTVGQEVRIVSTRSSQGRSPDLIGKIGRVVRVPAHPNTWFKVRFEALNREATFRAPSMRLTGSGSGGVGEKTGGSVSSVDGGGAGEQSTSSAKDAIDAKGRLPMSSYKEGMRVKVLDTANVRSRFAQHIGRYGAISSTSVHPSTWFWVEMDGDLEPRRVRVQFSSITHAEDPLDSVEGEKAAAGRSRGGADGAGRATSTRASDDVGDDETVRVSLESIPLSEWAGKRVIMHKGKQDGKMGVIVNHASGWVSVRSDNGVQASKRAGDLTAVVSREEASIVESRTGDSATGFGTDGTAADALNSAQGFDPSDFIDAGRRSSRRGDAQLKELIGSFVRITSGPGIDKVGRVSNGADGIFNVQVDVEDIIPKTRQQVVKIDPASADARAVARMLDGTASTASKRRRQRSSRTNGRQRGRRTDSTPGDAASTSGAGEEEPTADVDDEEQSESRGSSAHPKKRMRSSSRASSTNSKPELLAAAKKKKRPAGGSWIGERVLVKDGRAGKIVGSGHGFYQVHLDDGVRLKKRQDALRLENPDGLVSIEDQRMGDDGAEVGESSTPVPSPVPDAGQPRSGGRARRAAAVSAAAAITASSASGTGPDELEVAIKAAEGPAGDGAAASDSQRDRPSPRKRRSGRAAGSGSETASASGGSRRAARRGGVPPPSPSPPPSDDAGSTRGSRRKRGSSRRRSGQSTPVDVAPALNGDSAGFHDGAVPMSGSPADPSLLLAAAAASGPMLAGMEAGYADGGGHPGYAGAGVEEAGVGGVGVHVPAAYPHYGASHPSAMVDHLQAFPGHAPELEYPVHHGVGLAEAAPPEPPAAVEPISVSFDPSLSMDAERRKRLGLLSIEREMAIVEYRERVRTYVGYYSARENVVGRHNLERFRKSLALPEPPLHPSLKLKKVGGRVLRRMEEAALNRRPFSDSDVDSDSESVESAVDLVSRTRCEACGMELESISDECWNDDCPQCKLHDRARAAAKAAAAGDVVEDRAAKEAAELAAATTAREERLRRALAEPVKLDRENYYGLDRQKKRKRLPVDAPLRGPKLGQPASLREPDESAVRPPLTGPPKELEHPLSLYSLNAPVKWLGESTRPRPPEPRRSRRKQRRKRVSQRVARKNGLPPVGVQSSSKAGTKWTPAESLVWRHRAWLRGNEHEHPDTAAAAALMEVVIRDVSTEEREEVMRGAQEIVAASEQAAIQAEIAMMHPHGIPAWMDPATGQPWAQQIAPAEYASAEYAPAEYAAQPQQEMYSQQVMYGHPGQHDGYMPSPEEYAAAQSAEYAAMQPGAYAGQAIPQDYSQAAAFTSSAGTMSYGGVSGVASVAHGVDPYAQAAVHGSWGGTNVHESAYMYGGHPGAPVAWEQAGAFAPGPAAPLGPVHSVGWGASDPMMSHAFTAGMYHHHMSGTSASVSHVRTADGMGSGNGPQWYPQVPYSSGAHGVGPTLTYGAAGAVGGAEASAGAGAGAGGGGGANIAVSGGAGGPSGGSAVVAPPVAPAMASEGLRDA